MIDPPAAAHDEPDLRPRSRPFDLDGLDIPHPAPFTCDLRVDRSQLGGTIEHVSNVHYVRWLDRAAELHSDAAGHSRRELLDAGVMWFVARHEIDYLAEAWLDDELIIATWVREIRRVKAWRDYVIVRPRDGCVICRASTLWVLVDLSTRRPTRISEQMQQAFAPLFVTSAVQKAIP